MEGVGALEVGFYGKLPTHGDFLRRRVSDRFVTAWDEWLQACVAASRTALGARWLDVYLTSPVWRFACSPGLVSDVPVLGLMGPSVDRVGRYYHLTIVAEVPTDATVVAAAAAAGTFFERAERLVVDTLAADAIEFDSFDRAVNDLAAGLDALLVRPRAVLDPVVAEMLAEGSRVGWQLPTGGGSELRSIFDQVLGHRLAELYQPLVLWWTDGSAMVEPSCLVYRGLPEPDAFAALLDGSWDRRYWCPVPADVAPAENEGEEVLADDPTPPRYRSAGGTDAGKVRSINQDSFLERPEVGLWVVADGLGGHSDGEVASRMVCDALADFIPDASFERMIEEASERVQEVNGHLVRAATRPENAVVSGSTVVALLTRGTRCAVIWAGDSRAYRVRRGHLEQLTLDHSLAVEARELAVGESANAITRAVGGEAVLSLDVYRDRVRAGDRFLLCSDGLTRTVPEEAILEWMQHEYISAAAQGLVNAALEAGAPDNVTVIVVEAYAPGWT